MAFSALINRPRRFLSSSAPSASMNAGVAAPPSRAISGMTKRASESGSAETLCAISSVARCASPNDSVSACAAARTGAPSGAAATAPSSVPMTRNAGSLRPVATSMAMKFAAASAMAVFIAASFSSTN
jgi:hypothetical protein